MIIQFINAPVGSQMASDTNSTTYKHKYKNTLNRTTTKGRINKNIINLFFFRDVTTHRGPGPPQCRGFRIKPRHTTVGRTPV
jgi:hypothetical protein